jgi:hypothetical protein
MESASLTTLTQQSAAALSRLWIEDRIEKPTAPHAWSQMRWLMDQLAHRCVAESLRLAEDEDCLFHRLSAAHDVISLAWYSVERGGLTQRGGAQEKKLPSQEKERIEKARHTLWTRRDPKRAFVEGTLSEHHTAIDKDALHTTIAEYLNRPYLRHSVLDWIFLDMTISRELCAYGECIKQHLLPGRRDRFLGIHEQYIKAHGNLAEMTAINWSEFFKRCEGWFAALVFSATGIWAAFHWHFNTTGWWLAGICGTLFVGVRLRQRLTGKIEPWRKASQLWDSMYEVWRRLEGPVANPTRIREAMLKSASEGAVWDNVSWSLIDRVAAIDSVIWVVQQTGP